MVMDPPWENASAQRSSQYPTLPSRNLLRIPMKRLLHQVLPMPRNLAQVCVKATNRQLKISLPPIQAALPQGWCSIGKC